MNSSGLFRNINKTTCNHIINNTLSNVPLHSYSYSNIPATTIFKQLHVSKSLHNYRFNIVRKLTTHNNNKKIINSSSSISNGPIGWYLGMIKSKPIFTKCITSALIYTVADFTSQKMTQASSETYDLIRTCRMAGYGLIVAGPLLHFWFNFVSRVLPKQDMINTLKKMFMGQAIFGPIMTATFFSVNAALQGEKGNEIVARLKRDMLPTMINNVIYWPLCDFITFRFVPVHLQPLASNSFSYVWTIYITYMANLAKAEAN
uniref:PXMP2/4 family protein 3-like n=1 Tax=Erigeron canadensis TaxID=72917 RepID=UPI001CB92C34|nr:PXMP2/4 family protein 3-like [Erigeron canadensis]